MPTNFPFLTPAYAPVVEPALRAESLALSDPRAACFYARRALEVLVNHVYDTDSAFQRPWATHLSSLLAAPCFAEDVPAHVVAKARVIRDLGNMAVHGRKAVRPADGVTAVRELFHVCYWFART